MKASQILTAAEMRGAEQALFDAVTSVFDLMEIAAGGAAEWVRRIAAGRSVTVLCGPGNNGGDGYVIARRLREAGNPVGVVAPVPPTTDAAVRAREAWGATVLTSGGEASGAVLVDCLFGSGLSRPLSATHALLLRDLAARHSISIAIDVPSGIESDTGELLNERLPDFDVTLALGAWKFAHWCLPGRTKMGTMRLVPIGTSPVEGAAVAVPKPSLQAPAVESHKYTRGLVAIIGGSMPGAAQLAALAAMRGGAGYVKLFALKPAPTLNPALVSDHTQLSEALSDPRLAAALVGPGLGRDATARARLGDALRANCKLVLDADALMLLEAADLATARQTVLATPHDGELAALCRAFSVVAEGRCDRARALARASGMVVLAKGPDTFIAAPDGRLAIAPPAPSWLSVAGSGDVLAGIALSRIASGKDVFEAACEAVWLHGKAARLAGPVLTADDLAGQVSKAIAQCL